MTTRKLSILVTFIAFSIVGAMIKIPAVISSIALDSFPALAGSVLLGPVAGAIIGALGHLGSAFLGGLPLGPLHLLVAVEMAVIVFVFGYLYRSNKRMLAYSFFLISNGFVAAIPFGFIISWSFYVAFLPPLLIGTAVNLVIAIVALPRIQQATNVVLRRNA
ncbi:ECF transporter S component [Bacillus solimangrovi]|uniref:ECF transporter S component n=1 Tax=Bacillus solimangrovi TaxID=1305675 RepID=A0A1E5LHF7_9BACI|nr:ECF transporter S component [Bacillus solimangrovi]OEH93513.1 ECF transporter S component [Bacillus solimangrovi]